MRRQVEQALQDEMAALRDPERKIEAWASRLAEIERVRVAHQRQQAEGLMTLEELRGHLGELDEQRTDAESELDALRDSGRRLDELWAYSDLIEEHLRELPFLVQGRDGVIRD
jgi:chromosome segregation ATPase